MVLRTHGILLEVPPRFVPHHLHRAYEPLTTEAFVSALRPGGTAVDVGAHLGYYACVAAQAVGPEGVVHAVEPGLDNQKLLLRNADLNGFSNLRLLPVAAGHIEELRSFMLAESSDSHSFYTHPLSAASTTTTVRAVPLDNFIAGPVDVIKIDVEGAECEALLGMSTLLRSSPGARVLLEWNPQCLQSAGRGPEDLPDLASKLGLEGIYVVDDEAGARRELPEVLAHVAGRGLPAEWHVTLVGHVGT